MAKPRIWYREQTKTYYCTIAGKQHSLGKDEEEAKDRYEFLLGAEGIQGIVRVDDLLDKYLDFVSKNRSKKTYRTYRDFIKSFNNSIRAGLLVVDLKPLHVQNWLDSQTRWGSTSKNRAITTLKTSLNWAIEQGYISVSPIARMKKPRAQIRETVITTKQWNKIGKTVKDRAFRDFLMILKETGCRPQEARFVEASHIRGSAWVFNKIDSKGQRYNRVVHLSTRANRITKRLMEKHPTGKLFRDIRGKPWTSNAIICRFRRLSEKLGTRIFAYSFRHTFATRALEKGVDSVTVGTLMGHRDTSMVSRVYGHISGNRKLLRNALEIISGGVVRSAH
jgi:integrase